VGFDWKLVRGQYYLTPIYILLLDVDSYTPITMDDEFIMISGKDLLSSMQVKSKVNLQAYFTQDFGFSLRSSS
jgi:hypothetical protein